MRVMSFRIAAKLTDDSTVCLDNEQTDIEVSHKWTSVKGLHGFSMYTVKSLI